MKSASAPLIPDFNKLTDDKESQTVSNKTSIKKRSHDDWQRLIADWENSGLSQKKFCEQRKIHPHNFVYHRHRILKKQRQESKFASVNVTSSQNVMPLNDRFIFYLKNGTKLSIPNHYDSVSLKQLLTLLGVLPC